MTSLRQIESNRRNAQRSTGPKTQSGKARSSQNAVRHGLTAETVIGPLEDPADYRAFEQAVTTAYDAETAVERELVLRLASLLWRLRRATSVETGLLQIQCEASTAPDPALPKLPGEVCEVIEIFQSGCDFSATFRCGDATMGCSFASHTREKLLGSVFWPSAEKQKMTKNRGELTASNHFGQLHGDIQLLPNPRLVNFARFMLATSSQRVHPLTSPYGLQS